MVYLFLADGFEEVEALCPLDLLRRAGADVKTVAVGTDGKTVTGSHGIPVTADITEKEVLLSDALEMVILPGGMPGTKNLDASETVHKTLGYAVSRGITTAAICAAPMILGKCGYLAGRAAICYPGFEKYLTDATISAKSVVTDENFITAKGMGVALQFGLTLVAALYGEGEADRLRASVMADV